MTHAVEWDGRSDGRCPSDRHWRASSIRPPCPMCPLRPRRRTTLIGADLQRVPRETSLHPRPLLPSMRNALPQKCGSRGVWSLPGAETTPISPGEGRRSL
jgi:hypothetical protein